MLDLACHAFKLVINKNQSLVLKFINHQEIFVNII